MQINKSDLSAAFLSTVLTILLAYLASPLNLAAQEKAVQVQESAAAPSPTALGSFLIDDPSESEPSAIAGPLPTLEPIGFANVDAELQGENATTNEVAENPPVNSSPVPSETTKEMPAEPMEFKFLPVELASEELAQVDQLLLYQLEFAKGNFKIVRTPATYTKLIEAYLAIIEQHCWNSQAPSTNENPPAISPLCQKFLYELSVIDARHHYLVCARSGFNSPACAQGFALVKVAQVDPVAPTTGESGGKELNLEPRITAMASRERVAKLEQDLFFADRAFRSDQKPEKQARVVKILSELVSLTCQGITTSYSASAEFLTAIDIASLLAPTPAEIAHAETDIAPQATPKSSLVPDDSKLERKALYSRTNRPLANIEQRVAAGSGSPDSAALPPDPVSRARVMSPKCFTHLSRLSQVDPHNTSPPCIGLGPYSPQCHAAQQAAGLRAREAADQERKKKSRTAGAERGSPTTAYQPF